MAAIGQLLSVGQAGEASQRRWHRADSFRLGSKPSPHTLETGEKALFSLRGHPARLEDLLSMREGDRMVSHLSAGEMLGQVPEGWDGVSPHVSTTDTDEPFLPPPPLLGCQGVGGVMRRGMAHPGLWEPGLSLCWMELSTRGLAPG